MSDQLLIRLDDLNGKPTRELIARHLRGMHESSPAESVHAFDIDKLKDPGVTFWSVWIGNDIAGCGALKDLGGNRGEIKSMRVADAYLGKGVGRAILHHIIAEAQSRGMKALSLETGSSPAFKPALSLYASNGFKRCGPFEGYTDDPFSIFMTRTI